jgi:hypothetical protein
MLFIAIFHYHFLFEVCQHPRQGQVQRSAWVRAWRVGYPHSLHPTFVSFIPCIFRESPLTLSPPGVFPPSSDILVIPGDNEHGDNFPANPSRFDGSVLGYPMRGHRVGYSSRHMIHCAGRSMLSDGGCRQLCYCGRARGVWVLGPSWRNMHSTVCVTHPETDAAQWSPMGACAQGTSSHHSVFMGFGCSGCPIAAPPPPPIQRGACPD